MTDKTCGRCGGFGTIKVPRGGFEYSEYPCAECTVTDLTAEQRADLKAKAEATLRAGERTAAEPPCRCEDCEWASVVLALLAENERLQRELGLHKLNDVGQCPMCYSAGYEAAEAQLTEMRKILEARGEYVVRLEAQRNAANQELMHTIERTTAEQEGLVKQLAEMRAALERIAHRTERIVNKEVGPMTAYAAAHYDLEVARAALAMAGRWGRVDTL